MAPKTVAEQQAQANGKPEGIPSPDDLDLAGLQFRPLGKLKLNEVAEIEREIGRKVATDLAGDFGVDFLIGMLWLELRKQHPKITYEQAGEHAVGNTIDAIYAALVSGDEPEPDPPTGPGGSPGRGAASSEPTGSSFEPVDTASRPSSAPSTA